MPRQTDKKIKIPKPTWKQPEPRQPLWRRLLIAIAGALSVFSGGRGAKAAKLPTFIQPVSNRVRARETATTGEDRDQSAAILNAIVPDQAAALEPSAEQVRFQNAQRSLSLLQGMARTIAGHPGVRPTVVQSLQNRLSTISDLFERAQTALSSNPKQAERFLENAERQIEQARSLILSRAQSMGINLTGAAEIAEANTAAERARTEAEARLAAERANAENEAEIARNEAAARAAADRARIVKEAEAATARARAEAEARTEAMKKAAADAATAAAERARAAAESARVRTERIRAEAAARDAANRARAEETIRTAPERARAATARARAEAARVKAEAEDRARTAAAAAANAADNAINARNDATAAAERARTATNVNDVRTAANEASAFAETAKTAHTASASAAAQAVQAASQANSPVITNAIRAANNSVAEAENAAASAADSAAAAAALVASATAASEAADVAATAARNAKTAADAASASAEAAKTAANITDARVASSAAAASAASAAAEATTAVAAATSAARAATQVNSPIATAALNAANVSVVNAEQFSAAATDSASAADSAVTDNFVPVVITANNAVTIANAVAVATDAAGAAANDAAHIAIDASNAIAAINTDMDNKIADLANKIADAGVKASNAAANADRAASDARDAAAVVRNDPSSANISKANAAAFNADAAAFNAYKAARAIADLTDVASFTPIINDSAEVARAAIAAAAITRDAKAAFDASADALYGATKSVKEPSFDVIEDARNITTTGNADLIPSTGQQETGQQTAETAPDAQEEFAVPQQAINAFDAAMAITEFGISSNAGAMTADMTVEASNAAIAALTEGNTHEAVQLTISALASASALKAAEPDSANSARADQAARTAVNALEANPQTAEALANGIQALGLLTDNAVGMTVGLISLRGKLTQSNFAITGALNQTDANEALADFGKEAVILKNIGESAGVDTAAATGGLISLFGAVGNKEGGFALETAQTAVMEAANIAKNTAENILAAAPADIANAAAALKAANENLASKLSDLQATLRVATDGTVGTGAVQTMVNARIADSDMAKGLSGGEKIDISLSGRAVGIMTFAEIAADQARFEEANQAPQDLSNTVTGGDADLAIQAEHGEVPGGGLRGVGESDTPIGDTLPGIDIDTLGTIAQGVLGAVRVGKAITDETMSEAERVLGGAGGALQMYNAAAKLAPELLTAIPYANWIAGALSAASAGATQSNAGAGAIAAAGAAADVALNVAIPGISVMMVGHGIGDVAQGIIRIARLEPDLSHGARERSEVGLITAPVIRYAQYLAMSSTPEELDQAMSLAPQLRGLVLSEQEGKKTISVQAGVRPEFIAPLQKRLDVVIESSRALMAFAGEGNPAAQNVLADRARQRAEFIDAVDTAMLLPIDVNTGSWSGAMSGSLGSYSQPMGTSRESVIVQMLVAGGATQDAQLFAEMRPTGGVDPNTGAPILAPVAGPMLNLQDIASRVPKLSAREKEARRGALWVQDPERGTWDLRPQGMGAYVPPPETEEEITQAWEKTQKDYQDQAGGGE